MSSNLFDKPAEFDSKHLSNWAAIARLLRFAWNYRQRVAGLLGLQMILLLTSILAIQLGGFALDWIKSQYDHSEVLPTIYGWHPSTSWANWMQVTSIAAIIAAVSGVRAVLNYAYAVSNGKFINEEMVVDLRVATFEKLQRCDFDFYNANDTSSLVNRLTGDIQLTRSFVDGVIVQVSVLAMSLVFFLTTMLRLHVGLTLAALASTPFLVLKTYRFSREIRPQYDRNRELFDAMMLRVNENAEGQHAIKAFGSQARESEKFDQATRNVEMQQRNIFWKVSTFTPTIQLLSQCNVVILLVYGGYLVINDQLPLGSGLIVFAGLIQQFSSQVTALSQITNTIEQSLAGARRVFEVIDTPVRIANVSSADANNKPTSTTVEGRFEFDSVCFAYRENDPVLSDISVVIEPRTRIGVVGMVGSGKSTLLQLLPRFYDPTSGIIRLDGIDLCDYELAHLRRSIGFVFQDPFLFSDTIAANIGYGNPNATQQDIEAAAKLAAVDDFIGEMPNGYETVLGQFGLNLSGGQRQRLALARAIVLDPPILVLDDPTSAVDPGTEHEIWHAMNRAFADRTSILVTNRTHSLINFDRILVLEHGRLVADGTHEELCNGKSDLYAEIVAAQMQLL